MPRAYRSRVVQADEVACITRNGQDTTVKYKDGGGMSFKIGPNLPKMTDAEVLKQHNVLAKAVAAADMNFVQMSRKGWLRVPCRKNA